MDTGFTVHWASGGGYPRRCSFDINQRELASLLGISQGVSLNLRVALEHYLHVV
jgi:hypothetical protein